MKEIVLQQNTGENANTRTYTIMELVNLPDLNIEHTMDRKVLNHMVTEGIKATIV